MKTQKLSRNYHGPQSRGLSVTTRRTLIAVALGASFLTTHPAYADIIDWNVGTTAPFSTAADWTDENGGANVVPTTGNIADIINGGTATIGTGDSFTVDEIWAGNGANGGQGAGNASQTGGLLTVNNWFVVGRGGQTGTYTFSGGTINKGGGGNTIIGEGGTGQGTMTVSGASTAFNINGGELWIGQAGGTGTLVLNSGSVTTNTWAVLARADNSSGTLTINGGTFTHNAGGGDFEIGSYGVNHHATLNLNGGLLTTNFIRNESGGGSTSTLNFNGGTLQANASDGGFLGGHGTIDQINVENGGAVVDTNGNAIGITQGLNHSIVTGDNATDGGLTKIGAGALTLSAVNTYTGDTNVNAGTLAITGGSISSTDHFVVNGTGTGTATVTQTGGSVASGSNELWIGNNGGSTGIYNISAGTLTSNSWIAVGRAGGTGTLNLSGTGAVTKLNGSNGNIVIGSLGAPGTVNQTGGSLTNTTSETWLGENGNATYNMSAGTATLGTVRVGFNNTGSGTLNISGGTMTAGRVDVGYANNQIGALTLSGTGVLDAADVHLGTYDNATGTIQLNGGTLGATQILNEDGNASGYNGTTPDRINFNGGTLQALGDSTNFVNNVGVANPTAKPLVTQVQSGGAFIDANGHAITIGTSLVHDTTANAPATDGGLTVTSSISGGALTLSNASTYTGSTTVGGNGKTVTLNLSHAGADGTGRLTVNSGATVNVTVSGGDTANDPDIEGGLYTISANNALGSGTTISGGTLKNLGFTGATTGTNVQNGGTLTIGTNGGTIDFGAGNTGATFNFTSFTDTNNATLDITDWTGNFTDGTSGGDGLDQLIFGGTPLTAAQLGDIKFVNPNGLSGTYSAAQITSDGEVAAAPEPTQVGMLGLMGLGLGGLLLRARKRRADDSTAA